MNEKKNSAPNEPLSEARLDLTGVDQLALLGGNDVNLRLLEEHFDGTITVRGEAMLLNGPVSQVESLQEVVTRLIDRVGRGQAVDEVAISSLLARSRDSTLAGVDEDGETGEPLFFASGTRRAIRARTPGQRAYVEAIRQKDIVFAIGPAGTGKTYLAVVMAMDYLKRRLVDRIVLVRPAVEAGEQLGYLPGDLQEKINPYLRPLYDALADIIGPSKISRYMASGVIEASPLAYMRGRTLNNAFVILDEAQNTTVGQMKMFLTRLGFQSKVVVTGDITQIDLRQEEKSGLIHVQEILARTSGVAVVELGVGDVQRHPLVRRIVDAFHEAEEQGNGRS
jgi:phosphate starvation-inducible PhoH-like protein